MFYAVMILHIDNHILLLTYVMFKMYVINTDDIHTDAPTLSVHTIIKFYLYLFIKVKP